MSDSIPAWADQEGRLWLDSGRVKGDQPVIELVDGSFRGPLDWVDGQFGPMEKLGGVTR